MAVFRVERNTGYTVMSNHHLRNKELSLKAKGLLSQMLSLPEDWDYTLKGLAQINRESIDAIREAVRELEQAGYLEKVSVFGRKEKPLRLTESGKRYTADKLCGLYRAEERAAAAMGAEQFAAMVEMTRKFTDSFEKEIRNGAE